VLRETTSLCGLVCPSRISERGGEGYYVCVYYYSTYYKCVCLLLQLCVFITAVCVCSSSVSMCVFMCVFYYCRTYYKAVRVGGGEWRTCAMMFTAVILCVFY
jgi:hypothetical protein